MSESLRSLTKNKRLWAIRSGRSEEIRDREQIAQVAHQNKLNMSDSLQSLNKNERMSESIIFLSESLILSFLDKKRAICSEIKWANSQPWYLCY